MSFAEHEHNIGLEPEHVFYRCGWAGAVQEGACHGVDWFQAGADDSAPGGVMWEVGPMIPRPAGCVAAADRIPLGAGAGGMVWNPRLGAG